MPDTLGRLTLRRHRFAAVDPHQSVLIAGPWIGELGVAMIRWGPYMRALAGEGHQVVCGGIEGFEALYADFASEYWSIPHETVREIRGTEQLYNDGVLHDCWQRDELRHHARRKQLHYPDHLHQAIAAAFHDTVTQAGWPDARVIMQLGEARRFAPLMASAADRDYAASVSTTRGVDRWVMVLPRLRPVQALERTWPPATYLDVITALARSLSSSGIAVVGSRLYEAAFADLVDGLANRHVVSLIDQPFGVQLAFWERAAVATGPPSGGLCLAYLLGVPLVHWEKPGAPTMRHGQLWRDGQEPAFSAAAGVVSEWIDVDESGHHAARLVARVTDLDERRRRACN
jgi:hypothetical protein